MTTLAVKNTGAQSRNFLEYARSLPYVRVITEDHHIWKKKPKPEVEEALLKAERGEDVTVCKDAEDIFRCLGI